MSSLPTTCHSQPWALVLRGGATAGHRPFTRLAYLVDTIAPVGQAIAVTAYIMNESGAGWTKHPRRVEWSDIVRQWARQPSIETIRQAKRRLPITPASREMVVTCMSGGDHWHGEDSDYPTEPSR